MHAHVGRQHACIELKNRGLVTSDGYETLRNVSVAEECMEEVLTALFDDARDMARRGEMEDEFIFFSVHGNSIYKQPTNIQDYNVIQDSSVYHSSRQDYKIHGTILKTALPEMMADEALVCEVYKHNELLAVIASLPEQDYVDTFTVFSLSC